MASGNPIVATALIEVKPDPASLKTFASTVRTKLSDDLKKNPIKLPVAPTITGPWKRRVQEELRKSNLTVPVTPVLNAQGRAALERQVRAQMATITAPIPISVGRAAGVEGAAGAAQGLAAAEFEIAKAGLSAAEAQVVLNAAAAQGAIDLSAAAAATTNLKNARDQGTATDVRATEAAAAMHTANLAGLQSQAKLAEVENAGRFATSELAKLKRQYAVAEEAAALATSSYVAALQGEDIALTSTRAEMIAAAEAQVALTTATLEGLGAQIEATIAAAERGAAEKKLAADVSKRAAAEATATRGAAATGLAALGARGATLAASSEFLIGAAAATAFFKSVQIAGQVQEELNVFRQTAKATREEMEEVSNTARELGADITLPGVSAVDAAVAMTELAKAGLSVQESMDAARGTLQLATAAQIDNVEAVNITASALNAFGLAGEEAVHIADLLAGAANEAQGGIDQMGASLSSVASVARQAGLSVEDTVAMLTLLAKNGIQGAEGGTALRVALLRLIAPTKKAREELRKLNVEILDQETGQVRADVFAQIAEATADLGARQRNAALGIIFGTRAIRAQAILGREGTAGLNQMRDATNQAGLAAELAGARTEGFTGKIDALKSSLETLGAEFGNLTLGPLGSFVELITIGTDRLTDFAAIANRAADVELPGTGNAARDSGLTAGEVFGRAFQEAAAHFLGLQFLGPSLLALTQGSRLFGAIRGDAEKASPEVEKLVDRITATGEAGKESEFLVRELFKRFEDAGGGQSALNDLVLNFQIFIQQLKQGGPESQRLAAELEKIVRQVQRLGSLPPVDIKVGVKPTEAEIRAGGQQVIDGITSVLSDQAADAIGFGFLDKLTEGAKRRAETGGPEVGQTFVAGLETQILQAEVAGDLATQIALARQRLANATAHRQRQQRLFDESGGTGREKALQNALRAEKAAQDALERLTNQRTSEAQESADRIATARNKADQAFLDALGLERSRRENAVLRAQGRAGLEDDIRTQTALRDFLVRKREEAARTLRDAKTRAETVASLTTDIIRANQEIRDLTRQMIDSGRERFESRLELLEATGTAAQIRRLFEKRIAELRKALVKAKHMERLTRELRLEIIKTNQDMRDALSEGFELDIAFAETTGNEALERQFRERYIRFLERQLAGVRKGTLEWKRIRNAIAEQREAIKDTKDEAQATFHEMAFDFLTRQQGFSANVFSNLLSPFVGSAGFTMPSINIGVGGASGGGGAGGLNTLRSFGMGGMADRIINENLAKTGKGGRSPTQGLEDRASAAAAGERGGTPAQFATIIHLLTQLVRLMGGDVQRGRHPESKTKQRHAGSSMDTM